MAVAFDMAPAECRARNRRKPLPVPAKVLAAQLRQWPAVRDALAGHGFDAVHGPVRCGVVNPLYRHAPDAARRQREDRLRMEFGLLIATFPEPSPPSPGRPRRPGSRASG